GPDRTVDVLALDLAEHEHLEPGLDGADGTERRARPGADVHPVGDLVELRRGDVRQAGGHGGGGRRTTGVVVAGPAEQGEPGRDPPYQEEEEPDPERGEGAAALPTPALVAGRPPRQLAVDPLVQRLVGELALVGARRHRSCRSLAAEARRHRGCWKLAAHGR